MDIRLKRAYEPAASSDGYRVLIDRLDHEGANNGRRGHGAGTVGHANVKNIEASAIKLAFKFAAVFAQQKLAVNVAVIEVSLTMVTLAGVTPGGLGHVHADHRTLGMGSPAAVPHQFGRRSSTF